ncbi:GNAT family N-acetyltransferase [Ruminococcus flavefaciens]|uniref:N-acetyltransferase domain-containing protein n=1 Tax=Ruminococcus flavefaciens 007c TaxID=1341157 RepID=W7UZB3_RUMFL|nr:GNAT family N-acetyltransferase [Ruminococcus flavefaciens]EWM54060.1 hypothetical protein RF007C_00210 [Ruminococcus flavefaciens 007c]
MKGTIKRIHEFTESEISELYELMDEFYENMDPEIFRHDFYAKDYCLVLEKNGRIVGFTTQKLMTVNVDGKEVKGVFSGDTIIHRDYWGDTELFRSFAQYWFRYAEEHGELWWFLICKGYKTYRILPLFWREFYPCRSCETPRDIKKIIDAYASALYPDEYNQTTGVVEYKSVKDCLRKGVADIDERRMKNKDIAFFCQVNPNWENGNDLVCLAKFDRSLLRRHMPELLFNGE